MIKWYFPTTDQPETYTLSYKVHDGLRYYTEGDQVWWKAVYGDRQFPVLASRVRVLLPAPAVAQQYAAYINGNDARDRVNAEVLDDGRAVIFDTQSTLDAGEELEARVEFTPGVVTGTVPSWQASADAATAQQEADQAFRGSVEPTGECIVWHAGPAAAVWRPGACLPAVVSLGT